MYVRLLFVIITKYYSVSTYWAECTSDVVCNYFKVLFSRYVLGWNVRQTVCVIITKYYSVSTYWAECTSDVVCNYFKVLFSRYVLGGMYVRRCV